MAQRLAVLAAGLQRSWQRCWAHHLHCLAEQALPCTRLWPTLPAATATPTCPGNSCSQMLSSSCLPQASLPLLTHHMLVQHHSLFPHSSCLTSVLWPSMCALSCSGVECQCETNALVLVIGDCQVVLRAHMAYCFLLNLPVSDSIHGLAVS